MQPRRIQERLNFLMQHAPAVVLLGPRQAGKNTLAIEVRGGRQAVYLSLENPKVSFSDHRDDLLILDEVQRAPELFQRLRSVIEQGRRDGKARNKTGWMNSQRQ